jgi:hypothetical protein
VFLRTQVVALRARGRSVVDIWQSPQDYDYPRPTWTRELLVRVAEEQTGIRVSVCTMGRVLRCLGARRGRPKPVVRCPLSDRQCRRRLRAIETLVEKLPENEVAVGVNQKAYLAGSLDTRDSTVLWVGDCVKNSGLFVRMLERLDAHYREANLIHVILDNYGIH